MDLKQFLERYGIALGVVVALVAVIAVLPGNADDRLVSTDGGSFDLSTDGESAVGGDGLGGTAGADPGFETGGEGVATGGEATQGGAAQAGTSGGSGGGGPAAAASGGPKFGAGPNCDGNGRQKLSLIHISEPTRPY